jgi:hypothetical protein
MSRPVEAGADNREHELAVLDRADLDDPTEHLCRLDEQVVVRPDQAVAAGSSDLGEQAHAVSPRYFERRG